MDLSRIDKNFQSASLDGVDFEFHPVPGPGFVLEGLPWREKETGAFRRLPETITGANTNDGIATLLYHTAGGAVRFVTDSSQIAVRLQLCHPEVMPHFPVTGSCGADLYRGGAAFRHYCGTLAPGFDEVQKDFSYTHRFMLAGKLAAPVECLINLPLYCGVTSIEIGLEPGSVLTAAPPRRVKYPIAFYGSSITQGGCASRPGNCYSSMLCRELDAEQWNLGFSGSSHGEPAVADEIVKMPLSALVMDYDHNAKDAEQLAATHAPFYQRIRAARPELPILMVSRCNVWPERSQEVYRVDLERRDIIFRTFQKARASGDEKVWFVDGESLFGGAGRTDCTVDGCHPNDLGFYRMYERLLPLLRKVIYG